MDVPRVGYAQQLRRKRILYTAIGVVALILVTVGLSRLEPAAPSVERATLFIDSVKRGEMLRQVRGPGTLVPEAEQWIAAQTDGRVERHLLPGVAVEPATIILELTSPELAQSAADAEAAVRAAEADYDDLRAQLEGQFLGAESNAAAIEAEFRSAELQAQADLELYNAGLVPKITLRKSQLNAAQLDKRFALEQQRLEKLSNSIDAQLAARRARVGQQRALHQLRLDQVEALHVKAGIRGVLQHVEVEIGQRVTPGTNLAKVTQPELLKAELRIPETQAKDVLLGQPVSIDTRNGLVAGSVSRIDPSVRNGTVTVDVTIDDELPKGARPDLSVDGTIEIERLEDVLYTGRPAYGQANSRISLFRLTPDEEFAVRIPVLLGRSSVSTIELVEGLAERDKVILSDTSQWDEFERIRLR